MYGRRPRTKSVAQILDQLAAIHALGAANIFVVDDSFIDSEKEAQALLTALADWQVGPQLSDRGHAGGEPERRAGHRTAPPPAGRPLHRGVRGTASRRPRAIRDAFVPALMRKHVYECARAASRQLERLVRDLEESEPREARASTATMSATG